MNKVVFFSIAIAIVLVSFLSSCAIYPEQCPGVALVESPVSPA